MQLGLTATPKRDHNADTYATSASRSMSIRSRRASTTATSRRSRCADRHHAGRLRLHLDDEVIEGEIEQGRRYTEDDFNRVIEIREREALPGQALHGADRPAREDPGVLRHPGTRPGGARPDQPDEDQHRPELLRASDGQRRREGERFLRLFQDNEKTIPTILTTSQKLSTGVDARNVRNIVLMRPVNSMIEFKQIIGRGTRLYDGKDYFTVYDFVKAYEHFNDPEWDGEPIAPEPVGPASIPFRTRRAGTERTRG